MGRSEIGVIGLAVMGRNLALNMVHHGFRVSVYNRSPKKMEELVVEAADERMTGCATLEEFVASLEKPRRILMMVKAGYPVDETISLLKPLLSEGDILIDGGNSWFEDTIRRSRLLEAEGYRYVGTGVSGGEEGALNGPAIMPGGQADAYDLVSGIFTAISAKVEDEPCCRWIGPDGAGHFVKMVHNGIEYSDMQLITEAWSLLARLPGLSHSELASVFREWNSGELDSYLMEITADILGQTDEETGKPMVDVILDSAGQKGTGKWTSDIALSLGIPTPGITEAVFARFMSALKEERVAAASILSGPELTWEGDREVFVEAVRRALYASKICAYAQGFALMRRAAAEYGWTLDYGGIAMIFRGGCIIRARFLNRISEAFSEAPALPNLMISPQFSKTLESYGEAWRSVVAAAALHGVPVPGLSSALAYFDAYRTANLPANLLQAQRDYFGAHTFERVDKPGVFHRKWM